MRQRVRANNCYRTENKLTSVFHACHFIDNEFHSNIVKVLSPGGATSSLKMSSYEEIHDQLQDRHMEN